MHNAIEGISSNLILDCTFASLKMQTTVVFNFFFSYSSTILYVFLRPLGNLLGISENDCTSVTESHCTIIVVPIKCVVVTDIVEGALGKGGVGVGE